MSSVKLHIKWNTYLWVQTWKLAYTAWHQGMLREQWHVELAWHYCHTPLLMESSTHRPCYADWEERRTRHKMASAPNSTHTRPWWARGWFCPPLYQFNLRRTNQHLKLLPCWLRNYFSTSFVSLTLIKMEIDALIVYFVPFMQLPLGLRFCCDGLQTAINIMFFFF